MDSNDFENIADLSKASARTWKALDSETRKVKIVIVLHNCDFKRDMCM